MKKNLIKKIIILGNYEISICSARAQLNPSNSTFFGFHISICFSNLNVRLSTNLLTRLNYFNNYLDTALLLSILRFLKFRCPNPHIH